MNQPLRALATRPTEIDLASIQWTRVTGGPEFDYPIDYSYCVAGQDKATNTVDFLVKWAPNAYCHYHRHLGTTQVWLLQGEQHLYETRDFETVHKVRREGFTGPCPDGEVHMEHAGPEGMTILFRIQVPDQRMFDLLNRDGSTILTATLDDLAERRLGETG